jgi:hypothetical protein
MAIWFLGDSGLQAMGGQLTSSSLLTTITTGNANTMGSWVPLHTATTFPVNRFCVCFGKAGVAVGGSNTQFMFNVGVGPSSSEVAIVQNIAVGGNMAYASWLFPISIPIGSRICVQAQALTALRTITMGMWLWGGGFGLESGYQAVTYGAAPASSKGTVLAAPASANTVEGAWTVISASTTSPMRWMVIGLAAPDTTSVLAAADHLVDIGVGAAGVEAAVITDIPVGVSINEEINYPRPLTFPVSIPVGSRLVARYRGTSTSTTASPNLTVTGIC